MATGRRPLPNLYCVTIGALSQYFVAYPLNYTCMGIFSSCSVSRVLNSPLFLDL